MKILFDGQAFVMQDTGGVSRYFVNLATGLDARPGVEATILAPLHRNRHLADEVDAPVLGLGVPRGWNLQATCRRAMRLASPIAGRLIGPDIVHETYFAPEPYVSAGRRRVVTVFDMIHELYVPGTRATDNKRRAVERCDHAICISHNTKKDLCEIFGFPSERASVTHLAYGDFSGSVGAGGPPELAGASYFLYVGHRYSYKNFETLLRAYAASPRLAKDFCIACFGGGPLTADERALATRLGLTSPQIVQLGGDDAALGAAYSHAAAFVYPSLYEGFGIPPLEAMSAGCPVISSNSSSLPEVVGDAALLFDPTDAEALTDAMERVVASDELRASLVERGHARRKLFTWARCVDETLEVYRKVL